MFNRLNKGFLAQHSRWGPAGRRALRDRMRAPTWLLLGLAVGASTVVWRSRRSGLASTRTSRVQTRRDGEAVSVTPMTEPSIETEGRSPALWRIRKGFWNLLTISKFRFNKPAVIPIPRDRVRPLETVPFVSKFPRTPISNIRVADHVPADEASRLKKYFYQFQVWLYGAFPPMQGGLPPIHRDPDRALTDAYTAGHRQYFAAPVLPTEFRGSPDLGFLAVAGPYEGYLERAPEGGYEWDLRPLGRYEHHDGLHSLGVRVLFRVDEGSRRLHAFRIESELGVFGPKDPRWELAQRIALCAASTHTSLVRHFNWIHLTAGAALAVATRNCLPAGHPLCRLLWPHIFGTQYSNEIVTQGQMEPGGDFDTIFSFTHPAMCKLFEDSYERFRFIVNDPPRDAQRRGIIGGGFDTPGLNNLVDLFEVMHRHAQRYISAYYATDDEIRRDRHVQGWLGRLDKMIPNGIGDVKDQVTLGNVSRLIGSFIHMVTVQHELLGTFMWNYQLWVDKQPARVYKDGRREPLDVYQRLVNANFLLNVRRKELLDDFSYLAVDARGRHAFHVFREELEALQARMASEPYATWKVYPRMLEANINA